jgi:predicted DNA-binding ribbon-helix-helix protein
MSKISLLDDEVSLVLAHAMKSQAVKRSVVIAGRKKSISLEDAVWESLREIAKYRDMTLFSLLATIDSKRKQGSLRPFAYSSSTSIASSWTRVGTRPWTLHSTALYEDCTETGKAVRLGYGKSGRATR